MSVFLHFRNRVTSVTGQTDSCIMMDGVEGMETNPRIFQARRYFLSGCEVNVSSHVRH
jgi:hypothetical protein